MWSKGAEGVQWAGTTSIMNPQQPLALLSTVHRERNFRYEESILRVEATLLPELEHQKNRQKRRLYLQYKGSAREIYREALLNKWLYQPRRSEEILMRLYGYNEANKTITIDQRCGSTTRTRHKYRSYTRTNTLLKPVSITATTRKRARTV